MSISGGEVKSARKNYQTSEWREMDNRSAAHLESFFLNLVFLITSLIVVRMIFVDSVRFFQD